MKKSLFVIAVFFLANNLFAQSVGINADESSPDGSVILDVKSTAKEFLALRMTAAKNGAVVSQTTELFAYQTDGTSVYYYNSGTSGSPSWTLIGAALGASQLTHNRS